MKKLLVLIVLAMAFISCDVNPSKVSQDYANEIASKVTYAKDERTGLCYAIVASRKTMQASQSGLGLAEVPCEKVEKFIK
jgi:hypothetical protein